MAYDLMRTPYGRGLLTVFVVYMSIKYMYKRNQAYIKETVEKILKAKGADK